jgi:hypothetical protein
MADQLGRGCRPFALLPLVRDPGGVHVAGAADVRGPLPLPPGFAPGASFEDGLPFLRRRHANLRLRADEVSRQRQVRQDAQERRETTRDLLGALCRPGELGASSIRYFAGRAPGGLAYCAMAPAR